jgi:choline dehydrogenase-like flavoprotein
MAIIQNPDAVIVGSGISGALIAKHLAQAGKKVVIIEAGQEQPPDVNSYMNRFLNATAKVPEIPYPPDLFDAKGNLTDPATVNAGRPTVLSLNPNGGFGAWQDPKQAYLIQKGPFAFGSTYERINAGTARHWLGTSLRNLPNDFEMKTKYNKFVDWPIKYEHLDPWYGLAEHEIGVSANKAEQDYLGITFAPNYNYPMPGIPGSLVDELVEKAMPGFKIGFGMENIQWKIAPTPAARNSQPYQNRRVCAGNTNCIPICPIQAKYDPSVTLAEALRTGNVEIRYKTVAANVVVDGNGRVSGIDTVTYATDKGPRTGTGRITAKIYIMAGNAIETPRLLLMSKNGGRTPNGVANSSRLVGEHLMDHPLYLAWALAPTQVWGYRGPLATSGIEVARDGEFRRARGAFRIEIGNEGWNFAIGDPNTTTTDLIDGLNFSGLNPGKQAMFGPQLVNALNDKLSKQFRLGFLVEQSPEDNCSVRLSAQFTDHLGLPRPEIRYDLSDYTKEGIWVAKQTADAIYKTMNAQQFTTTPEANDPTAFEWKGERLKYYGAGHLVGTHTMGTAKSNSVVDHMQKSWDHDNLYIVGSGSFPTVATANPTLTIAALCLRTADNIAKNVLR